MQILEPEALDAVRLCLYCQHGVVANQRRPAARGGKEDAAAEDGIVRAAPRAPLPQHRGLVRLLRSDPRGSSPLLQPGDGRKRTAAAQTSTRAHCWAAAISLPELRSRCEKKACLWVPVWAMSAERT